MHPSFSELVQGISLLTEQYRFSKIDICQFMLLIIYNTPVVYGYSSTRIWGGATGSHVTGSDVTGRGPVRKYVLRMRNRKLHNILPSRAFWPEVTHKTSRDPFGFPWKGGYAHAQPEVEQYPAFWRKWRHP